jgi:ATP-dependent DNA helicase 2 subunit 2
MADKEATVFIVDLGASMGQHSQGREMTNLDWCLQYVWNKVSAKVARFSFSCV